MKFSKLLLISISFTALYGSTVEAIFLNIINNTEKEIQVEVRPFGALAQKIWTAQEKIPPAQATNESKEKTPGSKTINSNIHLIEQINVQSGNIKKTINISSLDFYASIIPPILSIVVDPSPSETFSLTCNKTGFSKSIMDQLLKILAAGGIGAITSVLVLGAVALSISLKKSQSVLPDKLYNELMKKFGNSISDIINAFKHNTVTVQLKQEKSDANHIIYRTA